ncbi:MAG TPA: YggT family protein [Candidatus Dormibacteraeota bacterium]|nr:YggT family protein [Candidatus Dormibacteraeota bacterium]
MSTLGGYVDDLCVIETWLIVARIIISWFPGIDFGNPIVRALCAVTDPVLRVFRPILPSFAGIDVSPILAIVALRIVGDAFGSLGGSRDPVQIVIDIIANVILAVIVIAVVVVFLQVVLTFFQADPWHAATRMVRDMARPLTSPFASIRVRSRQVDMPAIVALAVYIASYFIVQRVFQAIIDRV